MNPQGRLERLRARLAAEGAEALLITEPLNVAYVTGFERVFDDERAHIALVTASESVLFTDDRYAEAASAASAATQWVVRSAWPELITAAADQLREWGVAHVAVEDTLSVRLLEGYRSVFGDELRVAREWVEGLRAIKEDAEVDRIAAAQQLTDAAFGYIVERIKPGVTEAELALDLEYFMRRNGSDGLAFVPIVASGPNSALPHAKVTSRALATGDFVKLDFGARVDGYCADMTRTVVLGRASARQRDFYEAVRAANEAGHAAVAPGVTGRDVDAAARAVIERRGLGELFRHGLGHGVGMEVHESPSAGPRSRDTLSAGHVITIEPGVYEPGFGGVRIEDLVVVVEGGSKNLTRSPKDLIEL